jgi:hypothetical protein
MKGIAQSKSKRLGERVSRRTVSVNPAVHSGGIEDPSRSNEIDAPSTLSRAGQKFDRLMKWLARSLSVTMERVMSKNKSSPHPLNGT